MVIEAAPWRLACLLHQPVAFRVAPGVHGIAWRGGATMATDVAELHLDAGSGDLLLVGSDDRGELAGRARA